MKAIHLLRRVPLLIVAVFLTFTMLSVYQNCAKVDPGKLDSASGSAESVLSGGPNPSVTPTPAPSSTPTPTPPSKTASITPDGNYVCSPFGGGSGLGAKSGVKAELWYLSNGESIAKSSKDALSVLTYFQGNKNGFEFQKSPETLYFNDIGVLTRNFESGFARADGSLLKDNSGNNLLEYFALKYEGVLKLGASDPEGDYELASLADDGTILEVLKSDGTWQRLITNDGTHGTKMGCMNQKINLTKSSRLQFRLFYNQGPRWRISNVLMWNYRGGSGVAVASDADIHKYCGQTENPDVWYYWNPTTGAMGSYAQWNNQKGWKIVAKENFELPNEEINPCSSSSYNLNPILQSPDGKHFDLKLSEAATVTLKVYSRSDDGSRSLVASLDSAMAADHSFETPVLDLSLKYEIELVMTIPAKSVQIAKKYKLVFN